MSKRRGIYLDEATDSLLDELAGREREREGVASRSGVVRRAVRELAEREIGPPLVHSVPKGRKRSSEKGGASD